MNICAPGLIQKREKRSKEEGRARGDGEGVRF